MFEPPEGMRFLEADQGLVVWAEPSEKLPHLVAEIHVGMGRDCQWSREAQVETLRGMINACEQAIKRLEKEAKDEPN